MHPYIEVSREAVVSRDRSRHSPYFTTGNHHSTFLTTKWQDFQKEEYSVLDILHYNHKAIWTVILKGLFRLGKDSEHAFEFL